MALFQVLFTSSENDNRIQVGPIIADTRQDAEVKARELAALHLTADETLDRVDVTAG